MGHTVDRSKSAHALPPEKVLSETGSSPLGLSAEQARTRLTSDGPNSLTSSGGVSLPKLILSQLKNPLIYMLVAAAALSLAAGHGLDAIVVGVVIVLNTLIGTSQEFRAERALEALHRLAAPRARVQRDGEIHVIAAGEVVVGDVLLLETGDRTAADARLIEVSDLRVDESALTGESDTVGKSVEPVDSDAQLADRTSMVWMTSAVTDGRARAVVVATGMDTVIGEIAGEVQATERGQTPLQKRLAGVGTLIGAAAVGFAGLVFVIGLLKGYDVIRMLLFAAAAAVSAIPEGLPAVISVVLAVGVQRMAKRNAIIRSMPAVETLGSTTVICSDKTGTITRNEMTATRLWAGGVEYTATGEGFSPEGSIVDATGSTLPEEVEGDLLSLLTVGSAANNATLEFDDDERRWLVEGNPTDGALLAVARKGGRSRSICEDCERLDEIPFSSRYKYMATLDRIPGRENPRLHVKGAFERILGACDRFLIGGEEVVATDALRTEVAAAAERMASSALRVVAGAYRDLPAETDEARSDDAEAGLVLAGLWGLLDPPRPDAIEAIAQAHQAGIAVKMITGDHAVTAEAIARQAGILDEGDEVVPGAELDTMSDEELTARVERIGVFARVSPAHKLRIVEALQRRGQVVAMTGDGVNDAPALKKADIGVSMGLTGTEVAKESSDMILTDDDFATIVAAVEEGRVIFDNLRRVVMFVITTSLGEIMLILAALLLGLPLPLTAIMILWVNLVTEGVSVIPLGLEPRHGDVLSRGPRPPGEGVLGVRHIRRILVLAPVIAGGTLLVFASYAARSDVAHAQTMAFTTLVAFEWCRAFSSRSLTNSVFSMSPFANKMLLGGISIGATLQVLAIHWAPGRLVFGTVTLSPVDWLIALGTASTVILADELLKSVERVLRDSGR
jgi:Ca2+-transporting ATPase